MVKEHRGYPDPTLFLVCVFLTIAGILVLASVSSTLAYEYFKDPFYFLKHQIIYGLIPALIAAFLIFKTKISFFKKWSFVLFLINLICLGIVFIPGIGVNYGGATRWLDLKLFSFQPSEFLKFTFLIYLAAWLESKFGSDSTSSKPINKKFSKSTYRSLTPSISNFIVFVILCLLVGLLLYKQPDLSTMLIVSAMAMIMFFTANTLVLHSVFLILSVVGAFWFLITKVPYAAARITIFFNQNLDPLGKGYQIKQALIAIGSGGIFGLGFGMSKQKFGFLPESMSDAIFSVASEELGFIGGSILILAFLLFLWRGLDIAKKSPDEFSRLVAIGVTIWIISQAFLNIGSIIKLWPSTGVPLPFISYGGSHLIVEFMAIGLLLNISKNRKIV